MYQPNGVMFLRSQNVYDDGLRLDDVVFIDEATDAEMEQTRVQPRDVLLNITGASIGRTAIVPDDLPPANVNQHVCIIRVGDGVCPEFVSYALKARTVKDQIRALENGTSREGLNFEQVGNMLISLPTQVGVQRQIVSWLDQKMAGIDAVLTAKNRMLGLLRKKRQALVTRLVTRGLDAGVRLKESGLPWLGKVPEHWSVERLKYRIRRIEQGWSPQCDSRPADPGEWGVLKVGCMNAGTYDESENKALPADLEPAPDLEVRPGDVLMSRSNTLELVGMVGVVHQTQGRILLCDKLYRIDFDHARTDPQYSVFLLRSRVARLQIERDASGASSSMKNISTEGVGNMTFAFPPVGEQRRIAARVTKVVSQCEATTARIEEQLTKLREYRQALITAAVTGMLDVRHKTAV